MSSPLIDQLLEEQHYTLLTRDNRDSFLQQHDTVVLFFTEDPKRYPETNDVAVILPELVAAFPGRFTPAVVDRDLETDLKDQYNISVWPALVFLRQQRYLGKISKVRDWSEYMDSIAEILQQQPGHNPGLGIPLVTEQRGTRHA